LSSSKALFLILYFLNGRIEFVTSLFIFLEMKRLFIPILILISILLSSQTTAQEKFSTSGRLNISLGTGFGLYNLSNNQYGEPNKGALNGNLQLAVDLGIIPILTGGVMLYRNGFAMKKDSSEKATISGLGVFAHLNFARTPSATLFLTAGLGGTVFSYENFNRKGKVTGTGSHVFAGLGFRSYIGNHFGIYSEVHITGYNYNSFTYQSDQALKDQALITPSGNKFGIALAGAEIKLGLIFALGKNSK
jgi:hypothetical protein